tara:strand:+ start:15502 stop:16446 length:945 start_codon:yes stop_codon:yes gene_type:complete
MPTERQNQLDRQSLIDRFYDEISKINWQNINSQTQKNVQIGLVGSKAQISKIKKWLSTTDYKLYRKYGASLKNKPNNDRIDNHTIEIVVSKNKLNSKLVKNADFCIVVSKYQDLVIELGKTAYVFDKNKQDIPAKCHADFTSLSFALSYNFPVFRYSHAYIEINNSSIQNMIWASATATPNVIPGPHQAITAPVEAISDVVILTLNEFKMLFELVGISGFIINPFRCLIELGMVIGGAALAQNTGTNLSGKLLGGAGIVAKGAVAFAFTYAIGDAVYFYLQTGQQASAKFIKDRVKYWEKEGKKVAKEEQKKKK